MNCILITGATGVIGSELVPLFLDSGFQVRLLMRARSPEHLQERFDELFCYWERDPRDAALEGRLEALAGDVSQPRLGLDEATWERLSGELTHIVHSAGNVKLNQPIEAARRSALDPARHIAELAWACKESGQFVKLDAVSTVGVAGRMQGLIPERPLTEPREFHNTYEQAKAEAEDFLLGELARGLPLTIHRPSMVVGRSDNGKVIRKQVFYYLCEFLTGTRTLGFLPTFGDATLDIVPVDYVVAVIHTAASNAEHAGKVFHECAGPKGAIRLDELSQTLRRQAIDRGEVLPPVRQLSPRLFRILSASLSAVTWGRLRRAMKTLPHFLAYLGEDQQFDNAETRQDLSKHDSLPPSTYLNRLFSIPRRSMRR